MKQVLPRGLYAITPDWTDTDRLLAAVGAAIEGGAAVLQYRNKVVSAAMRQEQAMALLQLCRAHRVPLIINDHLALALAIDADGAHLGGDDGDLIAARRALGPDKLLGASCYNRLALATAALAAGADHVGFGAAYASSTKPGAVHAPMSLYAEACSTLPCPVVAIGGIHAGNGRSLVDAGVHNLAVIGGVFEMPDVTGSARALSQLFDGAR
ncbi:MAG: thiamine phosphate synthase [Burkholderiales bacterium]|nr:thiamine phosphate synthase [Burkholderiales bacterium]